MTFPLTPLEFGERARFIDADRCAVFEGTNRLSYREFFDVCDRWASALAALGVGPGSRVVIIAQNTLAHLASYYAVPALGAVIVPVNFRLSSDDFRYIIQHSGATAASDSLRAFCREHLAHFKVPQAFHILQELPKTATGKVQKYVLRGSKPNLSVQ